MTEGMAGVKQAGDKVLPYIDDGVAAVRNWFTKPGQKIYDPRHIAQTIFDPTKAYTGVGEAAAATADFAGAGMSAKELYNLYGKWRSGEFDAADVPTAALNVMGTIPGVNYFKQFGAAVPKAVTMLYDDTVRAFNDLRHGVEPVYGITP